MTSEPLIRDVVPPAVYRDIEEAVGRIPRDMLSGTVVLITGANGFVGHNIVMTLLLMNDLHGTDIKVLAAVRDPKKCRDVFGSLLKRDDISVVEQDVLDPFVNVPNADLVIHAASQASADLFEKDPVGTINANLRGTDNVLQYALKAKARSVLFISSLKVYGMVPCNEAGTSHVSAVGVIDHTDHRNCYAEGKRAAEALCACYHKQYGMAVKIVRPSYIYGAASLSDDRVWAQFLANAVRGEDILLKSSGTALRSFCYVSDAVSAILKVLLYGEDMRPYNISAKHSDVTIREFAQSVVDVFPERELKLAFSRSEDETAPIPQQTQIPEVLDSTALEELGWSASVTIEEGIKRSVEILETRKF